MVVKVSDKELVKMLKVFGKKQVIFAYLYKELYLSSKQLDLIIDWV